MHIGQHNHRLLYSNFLRNVYFLHPWYSAVCILFKKTLASTPGKHTERHCHPTNRKVRWGKKLGICPWFKPIATNSSHHDTENYAISHNFRHSFNSCHAEAHKTIYMFLIINLQKSGRFPISNFHLNSNMNQRNNHTYLDINLSESRGCSFIILTH